MADKRAEKIEELIREVTPPPALPEPTWAPVPRPVWEPVQEPTTGPPPFVKWQPARAPDYTWREADGAGGAETGPLSSED